ncbi:hypothetical protein JY651_46780 [Pyxidicoccus parkwayensis]|uniref:MlpA protein n=1 Tax=Pyxidicoccus parkwayensis TaxID=2813578 RepID=A0ABX7NW00_9BACT|nr:hypothetical protein [Pyxidicoccus parkwaysis]QSQ22539.1 hypothetical protein JY651_46780 [Pyxidicoccus parkwaysis]
MKLRLMGLSVGVAAASVAVFACNVDEPEPQCVVARASIDGSTGSFAATYTLKPGQNPDRTCAQLRPERVGLQKFFSEDPSAPDTVAVRSARLGKLFLDFKSRPDPDPTHTPYSVGPFASSGPGPDNFCDVPTLTPTRLDVPAAPAGLPDGGTLPDGGPPAQPAQSYAYEWSNLRIYNTSGIPGTQFTADLRYTENGCTAEYSAKGIWPVVACGLSDGGVNEAACDPYADYDAGRLRGSGINPIFPVKCDPVALICVLTGEVPSDREQP